MEKTSLRTLARAAGSDCPGEAGNIMIDQICIDTRTIVPGCLFIAIKGENFDGHDFIEQAYELGAAGVVTHRPVSGHEGVILVKDTRRALLDLARYYRSLFNVYLVGVTGSVGKTSTKEMIYTILSAKGKTLRTEGNFNNEIGMPLTMFRLDNTYRNAVMEMGMSAFGEISALTHICSPSVGVITNIGVAHLENLGSRENILKAKLEIAEAMPPDAPLVLNGDDDLLRTVSTMTEQPLFYYGIDRGADVTASNIQVNGESTTFTIHYYGRTIEAMIPVIGRHNVYNALAGFCVGLVADMSPEEIVRAMRLYKNAGMRQKTFVENGVTTIADCYNASPDSMRAAIDVITNVPCTGRRICVFGDMLELGSVSEESHVEVGKAVARSHIDQLICFGELSQDIKRGAMMAGMKNVQRFTDPQELAGYLVKTLQPGDAVIYKASRGIKLEDVIELVSRGRAEHQTPTRPKGMD